MRAHNLAAAFDLRPGGKDPSIGVVAAALQMSTQGVRQLVAAGDLPCRHVTGGWRTFRSDDVLRLVHRRAALRLTGRLPYRRRRLGARGQPTQLEMLFLLRDLNVAARKR